jgi:hypothetical protein
MLMKLYPQSRRVTCLRVEEGYPGKLDLKEWYHDLNKIFKNIGK